MLQYSLMTLKQKKFLDINPDLVFLSNGPGDPEDMGRSSK